jgi:hypothetical protein
VFHKSSAKLQVVIYLTWFKILTINVVMIDEEEESNKNVQVK